MHFGRPNVQSNQTMEMSSMAKPCICFDVFVLRMLVLWGTAVFACSHPWHPTHKNMYAAENRALKGFAYSYGPARSRVICGRDCSMDKRCRSFNFYDCKKMCELNIVTRREQAGDFNSTLGSVFFDDNEDTPLYSAVGK